MGKLPDQAGAAAPVVTKNDYIALAGALGARESVHRVLRRDTSGEALRTIAGLYEKREFVSAYERFKPVHEKVVAEMQRVLARNPEFEANKVAKEQRKPLAAAKEHVQKMKAQARQVVDQFDRLLRDLECKPLVRAHLKQGTIANAATSKPANEAQPTTLASAQETRLDADRRASREITIGGSHYRVAPYAPPEKDAMYTVRDKSGGRRIIRVVEKTSDGTRVRVETIEDGKPSDRTTELPVESLARQAAKGWARLLLPIVPNEATTAGASRPDAVNAMPNVALRLDSQNFGRCCADIARANLKFSTQLIKDVGDGPFRAGNFEQAFLTFEQLAVGFNSAVASSRRAIAEGRRELTAKKEGLSGKEIQERTAAFMRHEQLIHTAEREFSTILEGLRMYLRARQGNLDSDNGP